MSPTAIRKEYQLAADVEAAARELVSVEHRQDGSFISTPLIYPSGAKVIVRIESAGSNEFFVSDYGFGFTESDMIGATLQFRKHAPQIAEAAGVGFDHHTFFFAKVTRGQLPGAAVAIANCSLEAVTFAAFKLSEKRLTDDTEVLHRRLVSIFSDKNVAKDVEVTGQSQTKWRVSNLVRIPHPGEGQDHITIFEPVVNHHTSIAAAVTKFHDIARLDHAPRRVAVVQRKADFGTYLSVLSQAADVVAKDVPDSTIKKLAA